MIIHIFVFVPTNFWHVILFINVSYLILSCSTLRVWTVRVRERRHNTLKRVRLFGVRVRRVLLNLFSSPNRSVTRECRSPPALPPPRFLRPNVIARWRGGGSTRVRALRIGSCKKAAGRTGRKNTDESRTRHR